MGGNSLESLPSSAFSSPGAKLREIDLKKNRIREIHPDAFKGEEKI